MKEEAELPSAGFGDVISKMNLSSGENLMPWMVMGKNIKVRTPEEIKFKILNSNKVKDAMA